MKLKYKILWIENEEDWVESIEDQIQEYLEDLGFDFEKRLISKEEKNIDYNDYDLILMDLNLADQPNGAELISKIRELGAYTDVVFYSAMGIDDLRAKGKEKELEGVYYSGRTPEASFVKKVKAVIDSTIKKVQDLNNMRGLVMAEVSELDSRMASLIKKYFIEKGNDTKTATFKKHLVKDIEKATKKKLTESEKCDKQCTHKWSGLTINEIIQDFEFDASRKARAVKLIIDEEKYPYDAKNGSFSEDYRIDMLNMRNQLAHCVSIIKDGKEILKTKDEDIEFDDAKFKSIREQIKAYNALFDDIEAKIQ
jgi:CheY-like chemotaxis protein